MGSLDERIENRKFRNWRKNWLIKIKDLSLLLRMHWLYIWQWSHKIKTILTIFKDSFHVCDNHLKPVIYSIKELKH